MNGQKYPYQFDPIYDIGPRIGKPLQETKKWDVFEDPPVMTMSGSTEETKWVDLGEKVGKILAYILGFILVLGGGVVSKGTLIFMVAQLNTEEQRPYCNRDIDRNKRFEVIIPSTERIAWMWLLFFAFCVPQVMTFSRSARKLMTKTWTKPRAITFIWVFLSESLMTVGVAIFVYKVLPELDSLKALMLTNSVCFVPALLGFTKSVLLRMRNIDYRNDPNSLPIIVLDFISVLAQASAFIVWPVVMGENVLFYTIASGILISCGWWENFAPLSEEYQKLTRFENSRYFIYLFVSVWKCIVFLTSMVVIFAASGNEDGAGTLFSQFVTAFQEHDLNITVVPALFETDSSIVNNAQDVGTPTPITSYNLAPVWVFLIQVFSTYICYVAGKWACKIRIQGFSYSFPINLTVPVSLSILILLCGLYIKDECSFYNSIPQYLFFSLPELYELNNFLGQQQAWIWLFWLLSQAWITAHTWMPKCEKLATTEKLYVRPMYEPFFIDQDMALNRRIEDGDAWRDDGDEDEEFVEDTFSIPSSTAEDFATPHDDDSMTRIYACATMWHETKEEMMEFLKSIVRLDEDQSARRMVRERFQINMPDYYEIETHIFFDDAFVRMSQDDPDPQINEFVKDLVACVDEAASIVHEVNIRLRPPKKYLTPYGGRLVWTLPGKTKMIAHLKDKKKIRAKKRWSQVMYMYYLLGHKLMERNDISSSRKDVIGENTFLLALDGDIDFQPRAVHLLVELMKKNKTLGAACGRIHPLGSGPLAWYQMFEYAIGHWLQKATEHVIGCVLCSPGCFSLFRGKALMDKSVMKKYTTKSSEAKHYVQYDQGEDRWLCTLLLQRGYRVEYAAASDAFTHCPEGFNEFYNQRRRWMPSTTANIIDLLSSYKPTIKINDNLSTGYMMYQLLLLCSTVLGPGTIFLMLIGSFVAVFSWSQWTSFTYNIIPLMGFVIVCALFRNDKIQLFVAGILSGVYALVMMAVLVGIVLQTTTDGWLAPSSLFFFGMLCAYVITAILHPKEFNCLKFGLVYYVTIPSMYMLLVIYAVFNMNNVSWGTREVTILPKPQANANSPTPDAPKEEKKTKNWIINWCGARPEENKGAVEFSIASLFKCMWFTNLDHDKNAELEKINQALENITKRLDKMEKQESDEGDYEPTHRRPTATVAGVPGVITGMSMPSMRAMSGLGRMGRMDIMLDGMSDIQSIGDNGSEMQFENTWIDDEALRRGEVDILGLEELQFWNGLLDKYLHPIDDTNDKARIAQNLKDLRDKMVMAFFMINALFVLVIFLLTLNQDTIHIQWPFGYSVNFTYMEDVNQIWIYKEHLQLEPIGVIFLVCFASLIIIQFTAMFLHRFKTFSQIAANTVVNLAFWKSSTKTMTEEEIIEMNAVDLAKQLQKLKGADDEKENVPEVQAGRRKTIAKLDQRSRRAKEPINDLDTAFQRRYGKIQTNDNYKGDIRRVTLAAIERRKSRLTRPSGLMQAHTNLGYIPESTTA